jgi:hypothetical protein
MPQQSEAEVPLGVVIVHDGRKVNNVTAGYLSLT